MPPESFPEERNPKSVGIDRMDTRAMLVAINDEDARVAAVVREAIPAIGLAVDEAVRVLEMGGRIFYIGAGTSGRLAMADAAECPSTFNSPREWFTAVMAGGPAAFAGAVEHAEDDSVRAGPDLDAAGFRKGGLVVGVSASGRTPYTLAGVEHAVRQGSPAVGIVCRERAPIARAATIAIEIPVGPEVIGGSTRMKAGTAQKLALNMFSTAVMIRMGMTYDNWMINVRMTSDKLRARGVGLLEEILDVDTAEAVDLARRAGGELKTAVVMGRCACSREEAEKRLGRAGGRLRIALGEEDGRV